MIEWPWTPCTNCGKMRQHPRPGGTCKLCYDPASSMQQDIWARFQEEPSFKNYVRKRISATKNAIFIEWIEELIKQDRNVGQEDSR